MLKHRLSKFCSTVAIMLCVLFSGSFIQSCTDMLDDYPYDNERPKWLGSSIYDFLKGKHEGTSYDYYVRIIDSLDYSDVLARTGSKTLFIADDSAFVEFFKDNRWGVTRFEDLTKAQMKILLYSAMLDDAYLLDMMSSLPGNPPVENTCLRRSTSLQPVDSVPFFTPEMLPGNNKYWDRFREKGLLLSLDGTDPMMVHFLRDYMNANKITQLDVNVLFNAPHSTERSGDEAFIYQNQVLASGIDYKNYSDDTLTITCENGYVYKMDGVLLPPSNMAQELREHPNTKIFSRLLDRFSAPVYSPSLSSDYNYVNDNTDNPDSVFVMRYFNSAAGRPLSDVVENSEVSTVNETNKSRLLKFDPGWNQYKFGTGSEQSDMAAIYVPKDEYIFSYFGPNGPCEFLIELYATPEAIAKIDASDPLSINDALDCIPNQIIASFLNNLMQPSFTASVPSKFHLVQNDSYEELGIKPSDVDECVVANNGVIYILNNVFGPDEYRAVSAPALYMKNMSIMKAIIDALGYKPYLLAMDAEYTLIVPDNEYFIYYDPVTLESEKPTAYQFFYDDKSGYKDNQGKPIQTLWAKKFLYNPQTYELGDTVKGYDITPVGSVAVSSPNKAMNWGGTNFLENRMKDLLEYLIIVDNVESDKNAGRKYFQTKGYGTIKCEIKSTDVTNFDITFYGGEGLERGAAVKVGERYAQANGVTYCTVATGSDSLASGVPAPPTQTVYRRMCPDSSHVENFRAFFDLCRAVSLSEDSVEYGVDTLLSMIYPTLSSTEVRQDSARRYSVFRSSLSKTSGQSVARDRLVSFFNTYHYTVYVPTNDAVQSAYEQGLPTWDEIYTLVTDTLDENSDKRKMAASYIGLINRFARYHFQDNSIYLDAQVVEGDYETSALNYKIGGYYELNVAKEGNTLAVTDEMGNTARVINTPGAEGISWNVMAREMLLRSLDATPKKASSLETSSFVVMHQIDNILQNEGLFGYDGKYQRYANDGEPVDTMTVTGLEGSLDGKYLVASRGAITDEYEDGTYAFKRVGYLMKKTGRTGKFNQEEYVLNSRKEKILVDNDGYLRKETPVYNASKRVIGYTYTFVDADGNESDTPVVRVDNNGNIIPE